MILYTPSSSLMLHVDALRKNADQLLTPAYFSIRGGARKAFGSGSGKTIFFLAIVSNKACPTSPLLLKYSCDGLNIRIDRSRLASGDGRNINDTISEIAAKRHQSGPKIRL